MTYGKWNNSGELTFSDGESISADDLNHSLEGAFCPIGTVITWAKTLWGGSLPACWVECNGQVLSDANSPYNGATIPNLNGSNYFLRGGSTSGSTGGATTHNHEISTDETAGSSSGAAHYYSDNPHVYEDESSIPPYYNIVYIMRIK